MLRQTSRVFSSRQPWKDGSGETPFFRIAFSMNAICRKPATRIAAQTTVTRAWTARPGQKQSAASAAIHTRFRMLGISAAAAKRPNAFSTPMPNAAPQMKSMYGISTRTLRKVRSHFSESPSACASFSQSAPEIPAHASSTPAASMSRDIVITARASRCACFSAASAASASLNTGTNAAVSAPSPNMRRAMFGIANATANALCSTPAPISRLWNISRTSPSTREHAVSTATTAVFFRMPPPITPSPYGCRCG